MTLLRTAEPAAEPVTLADVKAHLKFAGDAEDALLTGLIRAAREDVERATGLALIEQGWRLVLDEWPPDGCLALSRGPVRSIEAVTVYAADGTPTVLAPSSYAADIAPRPARLQLAAPQGPALRQLNGVEVDFTAGFGEAGPDVPDLLRRAIVLLAAHWFEFRASYGAAEQPVSYPPSYERMIAGYRLRRL